MSKVEVNTIEPQCGTTLTVGKCTTNLRSGGNSLQAADGGNLISQSGTDITLGASGDTINLASGASQSGFGRTGTVDWVTTPKVTGDSPITAVTGKGYFLNTTAGTITINLPAGAAGSIVSMADYAATWNSNNVTIAANGSEKIGGVAEDATVSTKGQSVTFVYVDSTQGWVNTMDSTSNVRGTPPFITACVSGACNAITTCGDCKVATFLGPGTFTVNNLALCSANDAVSYLVVAGGGGGSGARGGGGGAGGFRELKTPVTPYTASPADGYPSAPNRIIVTATGYPITVGGGGPGGTNEDGSAAVFSTITSAGGGGAGSGPSPAGSAGGSGGGSNGRYPGTAGAGNTPPTTPPQGNSGGTTSGAKSGADTYAGSGGGGISAVGSPNPSATQAGAGGNGLSTEISGSAVTRAGGGGGGSGSSTPSPASLGGAGGSGGGGAGGSWPAPPAEGTVGTINTGSGGGGGASVAGGGCGVGAAGGSGIVIIRYKFQ